MLKQEEIRIRDPFVLLDRETGLYYVYGTTELQEGTRAGNKFFVYITRDLENFDGPYTVFDGSKCDFWADKDFWAAEVHKYKDKYYLFGSFKADNQRRATQILVSDSPMGEFKPISKKPQTPQDWECLDGTLYVEDNVPYLVFCHEWKQCGDGEIWAVKLTEDLRAQAEEPFLLFKASDNKDVTLTSKGGRVTDGPFLFKENGLLKLIWSSISNSRYVVLEATADSIKGRWTHYPSRFEFDGGHAMIFAAFDGMRYISLHSPNIPPNERMKFIPYE